MTTQHKILDSSSSSDELHSWLTGQYTYSTIKFGQRFQTWKITGSWVKHIYEIQDHAHIQSSPAKSTSKGSRNCLYLSRFKNTFSDFILSSVHFRVFCFTADRWKAKFSFHMQKNNWKFWCWFRKVQTPWWKAESIASSFMVDPISHDIGMSEKL